MKGFFGRKGLKLKQVKIYFSPTEILGEQEKQIESLRRQLDKAPDLASQTEQILTALESLKTEIKNTRLSDNRMASLSVQLDKLSHQLSVPLNSRVVHHHYVPKLFWIAIILVILVVISSSGWYITYGKLENYTANDTKYRMLRLDTALMPLQHYLDKLDSLQAKDPGMRERVIQKEKEYRRNAERLQKALRLKQEANELEQAARKR
ncbi:MAG: hypothetical protein ACTHLE_12935 [Agriterribacter sp.]